MIALWLGCAEADLQAPADAPVLDGGWVQRVAADTNHFTEVVNSDRPGWTALHRNDWHAAWAAGPTAHARAGEELARFHGVLATLDAEAWEAMIEAWGRRGGLPAESAVGVFARLAGVKTLGAAAAIRVPARFGSPTEPLQDWILRRTDAPVWALEAKVRGGDGTAIDALRTAAASPAWSEPIEGGSRHLYDPLVHATLAAAYGAARGNTLGAPERTLFSATLGPADQALPDALTGMGISLPTADDADACRAVIAALDAQVDPWHEALVTKSADGGALLSELRLVDGLRSRVLTTLAHTAIDRAQNACAAVYAQGSLDASSARTVGPVNHPTAYAVLALADLRLGRVREALDALQPLMEPFPETNGVREVTGDLSVLLGMDRIGDSREN